MRTLIVVLTAVLALHGAAHAARLLSTVLLPVPEGAAVAINDAGEIAGVTEFQREGMRAVRWTRRGTVTLPPLPGDVATIAHDINNRGQVVGASIGTDGSRRPVIWDRRRVTYLGLLPDAVSGEALDINDRGEVVGAVLLYSLWPGEQRAFIWRAGVISDLGPEFVAASGAFSAAWGINNRGQIVGQMGGIAAAFLFEGGVVTDLGTLGGNGAHPLAINERGQIVGASQTGSGETHAFLWQDGIMQDLGTLGTGAHSVAFGINDRGDVVGQTEINRAGESRAFLWSGNGMIDLGTQHAPYRAEGINNRGEIAGVGASAAGRHALLWTWRPPR